LSAGHTFAATSTKKDLTGALIEVGDDLHRQIDAKTAADRERRTCAAGQVTTHSHHPTGSRAGTNTPPVPICDGTSGNDRQPSHDTAGSQARETQLAAERVAHHGRLRSALVGFVEPYEKWRDRNNAREQRWPDGLRRLKSAQAEAERYRWVDRGHIRREEAR
jgi:hypothetical protein